VVALTWALEHAVPAPYSGYLAVVMVGLVATEVYKRQPGQQATRLFRMYLKARAEGADQEAARDRLLARLYRDPEARRQAAAEVAAVWTADSEKERVVPAVRILMARRGTRLDAQALRAAWDHVRDRFVIADWEALPRPFVDEVRGRLDEREQGHLDALAERYQLFRQRFFRGPSSLETNPAAAAGDFARLLTSLGNRLSEHESGDAERAYRLSLRLRPDRNLAHAGLALLLERTGRSREAAREARAALDVLDADSRRAADEPAPAEDISPFRTPTELRQALQRAVTGG
jgi:tetratricopeptide (TPR) repeat protein